MSLKESHLLIYSHGIHDLTSSQCFLVQRKRYENEWRAYHLDSGWGHVKLTSNYKHKEWIKSDDTRQEIQLNITLVTTNRNQLLPFIRIRQGLKLL